MKEEEILDSVIEEIGDIKGWTALDMGSGPCSMAVCLTKRIGDGRVFAVDLFTGIMQNLQKALSKEHFLRTVIIKSDLRRLDFLKNNFVDLITAYDTLSVVDQYTPSGTKYVLYEARRILKPDGWFIVIDHEPVESIQPLDKAEEVEIRFWMVHINVEKVLGKSTGTEYTMTELMETLKQAGFKIDHWKKTERGDIGKGMKFSTKIKDRANRIQDKKLRKAIFNEMSQIEDDGARYGMREFSRYVIYAKNSSTPPEKVEPISLTDLYQTIHRKDLLF